MFPEAKVVPVTFAGSVIVKVVEVGTLVTMNFTPLKVAADKLDPPGMVVLENKTMSSSFKLWAAEQVTVTVFVPSLAKVQLVNVNLIGCIS